MTGDATPAPVLKPCPFCGGEAINAGDEFGEWFECDKRVGYELGCWRGPKRYSTAEAVEAWNAAPRLVDGLRPEPAPQSLDSTRADLAWIRRALIALAERHGVTLPPTPRKAQT